MRKYKRKCLRTKNHWRFSLNYSINGTIKKPSDGIKHIYLKNDCACVNCIDYRSREHLFGSRINTKQCLVDKAPTLTVQTRRTKYFAKNNASQCQQTAETPINSDCESLIELFSKLYITEPTKGNVSRTDQKQEEEEVKKIVHNKGSERINIHKMTNRDENYESADSNGKKRAQLSDMHDMRERLDPLTRFEKNPSARQSIADLDDGYKTMSESVTSESIAGYCNWYTWEKYEWNENFLLLDKSTRNKYADWDQLAHEPKEKTADMFAFRDLGKYEEYCVRSVAAARVENIEFNSANVSQKTQEHSEDFWKSQRAQEEPVYDNLEKNFASLLNISSAESSISSVEDNLLHISVSDELADEQYQGDISTISPDDFHQAETFETVKCLHSNASGFNRNQIPVNGYDGCGDHYHWKYKGYAPLNDPNGSSTDSDNYDTTQEYEKCMHSMENKFAFIFDRTERLHRICYDTEYCKYDSIRTLNDCSDSDVQCEVDYSVGLTKRRRWSKSCSKAKYNDMLSGRAAVTTRKWSEELVWKSDEIPLLQESTFDESFATCGRSTSN